VTLRVRAPSGWCRQANTTDEAVRLAKHAAAAGVDWVCAVPPFFYKPSDDAVVAHYAAIAAAADLPFFCYNLPQSTNLEITAELMAKIKAGVPQLRGVKHSAPTFGTTTQFVDMGLDVFAGDSSLMLANLTLGGKGCIDGPPLMYPEIWVEIYDAWKAGDMDKARAAQQRAADIKFWVRKYGQPATQKLVLSEKLGIQCGEPRLPIAPLSDTEKTEVLAGAKDFGMLPKASL
jgi:dihydrodipicolinate synthase/N-acetylneuraminate lyase